MKKIFKQYIPASLDDAWLFFTDPKNLNKLTPPDMNFKIVSIDGDKELYPGMMISYSVSPLFNIGVSWLTEITEVANKQYFIDDQRLGPFKIWHHQHHFEEVDGGVQMTDIIHYKAPFGILGRFMEWLIINKRVESIFEYREEVLKKIFA